MYFNLGLLTLGLLSPIQSVVFYLNECRQSQTERTHPKQNNFIMMNWRYKKQVQKLYIQDADPSKWSLTNLIGSLESGGTF